MTRLCFMSYSDVKDSSVAIMSWQAIMSGLQFWGILKMQVELHWQQKYARGR